MALQKQVINIPVAGGIDSKSDPFQLPLGKMVSLANCVFTSTNKLEKRNGYVQLTTVPDTTAEYITTYNDDLIAIGDTIQSYSTAADTWNNRGTLVPMRLSVQPIVKSSTNQSQCDSVVSSNGNVCTVFTDQDPANISNKIYRYCISDVNTGSYSVAPTTIADADATYGTPRVFLLSNYFIIVYTYNNSGTYHLKYIAVPVIAPTSPRAAVDITSDYMPKTTVSWDGTVFNGILYLAWNAAAGGGINMITLSSQLTLSAPTNKDNVHVATMVSLSADDAYNIIWVSYYDLVTTSAYALAVNPVLNTVLAATLLFNTGTILNITSLATGGILNFYYEVDKAYDFDASLKTNYINSLNITQAGVVSTPAVVARSVGLASKAFLFGTTIYFLASYASTYQNTYFLINASGNTVAKLAYQNGGGYLTTGLPTGCVQGTIIYIPYLYKFAVISVNKSTGVGVYGQLGVNLASFNIDTAFIQAIELGGTLNVAGGFLWSYDGNLAVEQNFHLWPDFDLNLDVSGSAKALSFYTASGSLTTQNYNYVGCYEWQDSQGNLIRSAPSLYATASGASLTGSTNTIILNFPTIRLTYKIANKPKLVLYRSSTSQPVFYQTTSTTAPVLNDPSVDSVAITDASADESIVGNTILYTNGGVLENTGGPAFNAMTIFDNRAIGVLSENTNVLMISQPIIPSTPVDFSLFLTKFITPVLGSSTSSGDIKALGLMDDKCVLFKNQAISYYNGRGPDLTGNNSQYSEPIFITNLVGCSNQNSLVLIPDGLMFQSYQKGIWMLTRNLQVQYVGSEVEAFNSYRVTSAVADPDTTYVLFTLSNGQTLMYDYYFHQWGLWEGVSALSATEVNGNHTFLNSSHNIMQETPESYLDGSRPILQSLTTGWINPAGLQGYQRSYSLFLIGAYKSPHKLWVSIAYDYNEAIQQSFTITPPNTANTYGSQSPYGYPLNSPYGGASLLEQFRFNFKIQKCQSFQITIREIFDASQGVTSGAGFTLSGLKLVYGMKKGFPRIPYTQTAG